MFHNVKSGVQNIQWMNASIVGYFRLGLPNTQVCGEKLWTENRREAEREWREAESFYTSLPFVQFGEHFLNTFLLFWLVKIYYIYKYT